MKITSGEQELRRTAGGVVSPGKQNYNISVLRHTSAGPQYKTQLCKNYQDTGLCDFGSHCQFAHGRLELRNINQNHYQSGGRSVTSGMSPVSSVSPGGPLRVQNLCQSWLQNGVCVSGGMCGAAHSLNELSQSARAQPSLQSSLGQFSSNYQVHGLSITLFLSNTCHLC